MLKDCVGNVAGVETEAEPAAGRPRAAQEGKIWETQRDTEAQERGGGEEEEERGRSKVKLCSQTNIHLTYTHTHFSSCDIFQQICPHL